VQPGTPAAGSQSLINQSRQTTAIQNSPQNRIQQNTAAQPTGQGAGIPAQQAPVIRQPQQGKTASREPVARPAQPVNQQSPPAARAADPSKRAPASASAASNQKRDRGNQADKPASSQTVQPSSTAAFAPRRDRGKDPTDRTYKPRDQRGGNKQQFPKGKKLTRPPYGTAPIPGVGPAKEPPPSRPATPDKQMASQESGVFKQEEGEEV